MRIWLHAASVGEIQAAKALIRELTICLPEAELIVSTVTEQGYKVARGCTAPEITCIFAPLDLAGITKRVCNSIKPSIYVCLETELWPNMIREVSRCGAKVILLNGRLSERSFKRYRLIRGFMKNILAHFAAISVIQEADADRYLALGADPKKIYVHGNAKYDLADGFGQDTEAGYRTLFALAPQQPVLVAGSTHRGEEETILRVFQRVRTTYPRFLLVLAPRHLNRLFEVKALLDKNRVSFQSLSEIRRHGRCQDVVLVDTMGELTGLYSIATYVFCGGSLVPYGGHNIMEPAFWGKPIFYGPSMKDFSDAKQLLESYQAGFMVKDEEDLTRRILYFEDHCDLYENACQAAKEAAWSQQGAARRQVQLITKILLSEDNQPI